jgi:hypothetical protein
MKILPCTARHGRMKDRWTSILLKGIVSYSALPVFYSFIGFCNENIACEIKRRLISALRFTFLFLVLKQNNKNSDKQAH